MACIELNLNNGISVSFDADISLSTNSVINYLKNNPELEYTVNGERVAGNLYEFIVENLGDNITLNSGNLADTLIGNYKLTDTYPELEGSDYNILKVKDNAFITRNFFVSPNRIVAIASEANLDIVEKVMFVYNQLKSDNLAFITLVDELVKDDSLDIFDKFSQIINSDYDNLQEVIKRVPSKYNEELLTVGKDHYMLVKGVWKTLKGEDVKDTSKLWDAYFMKPGSKEISPISISDLKEFNLNEGDIVYTKSNQKLLYNGADFENSLGEIVSDDTIIVRMSTIRDQRLVERELQKREPLSYSRLRFVLDNTLSEFITENNLLFTDSNNPYIEDGKVYLKNEYQTNTTFAEVAIPIILNSLVSDKHLLELTNNGDKESINTLLNALLDFYVNTDDTALSGYDNVEDIQWIMNNINNVLDNSEIKVLGNEDSKAPKTAGQVSDDIIKKLMEDGNLTIYCVL